ncbi:hypothetical protein ES692_04050 [Psychroserpens burtonensis]|uniref:Uncharacterized protein n=1 Tax=Psychroserpens burtonensis TaxID=49278 RepID=A0A5C7BE24_9FLAO|nr:hypothetical protein [Psychroserpens burtonensis]TXE19037.1 hypothetical protein ES692_04050 [Psychroserpens burtonensis]
MKKMFSVLLLILFISTSAFSASPEVVQEASCANKALFTAQQITAEYEDANFFEVFFYAFEKCIEQELVIE